MDRSLVCQMPHDPTQRGQLEDELRLARSPYRRVAGHQANLVRVRQDQDYLNTEPRRRMSRLYPCVSPSYYDDIRIHNIDHPWYRVKYPSRVFPQILPQRRSSIAQVSSGVGSLKHPIW